MKRKEEAEIRAKLEDQQKKVEEESHWVVKGREDEA
jgi:hypothetical protein